MVEGLGPSAMLLGAVSQTTKAAAQCYKGWARAPCYKGRSLRQQGLSAVLQGPDSGGPSAMLQGPVPSAKLQGTVSQTTGAQAGY